MTLATVDGDDLWAAAVFYVNLDFTFFFLSAGHTRHARNIGANPWVAATIQEDYQRWQSIKGVQLEGAVQLLRGAEREQAIALYRQKFPFVNGPAAEISLALARVNWYRFSPHRLYFIDNSKGLGHRDEIRLDR